VVLQGEQQHRVSDARPTVAYALHDENGRPIAERNGTAVFYAASTIKLAVMLAVMTAVDAGDLELEQTLECPARFAGDPRFVNEDDAADFALQPQDADPSYPPDGGSMSVAELVSAMISRSSNEATNVLVDRVGLAAIADVLRRCGAGATRMQRTIGDRAAARGGLTNEISARDAATIMRCIVTGNLTTAPSTAFMRRVLSAQELVRIASVIPSGTMWGSKSGDVPGIEHDVAFVGDPDGQAPVRYLAICTRGYQPEQGREVIASLAAALLSAEPGTA
jgi:beta-lactamase class A